MSQPFSHPPFLALPSYTQPNSAQTSNATSSASTPRGIQLPSAPTSGTASPRKRKLNPNGKVASNKKSRSKSGVNDSRELDEGDDLTPKDMEDADEIGVAGGREIDDNYDEGEGDEDDGLEGEVDVAGADPVAGTGVGGRAGPGGRVVAKKGAAAKLHIDVEGVKAKAKAMKGDQMAFRSTLDTEELKRFDAFSSSIMPAKAMKKLLKDLYDQNLPDKSRLPQYLAGMAKVFVAEVVEIAKDLQAHSEHPTGALKPYHLKLAREVLEERGLLGASTSRDASAFRPKKSLFRR